MPILILIISIALQVFLTTRKVSPFISLLIVAIMTGFALGMTPDAVLKALEKGVSSTLGGLALILCLGAILGKILEISGAAEQIASSLLRLFGEKQIQWAMLCTGFLIGIPLYYNAGFVILVPLVFTVARKTGLPILMIAIPMAASLSTTHCFLPPHPGPTVLVNALGANMGKTLMYGILMAIPAVIVAGPVLGKLVRHAGINTVNNHGVEDTGATRSLPGVTSSFLIALLPVVLITVAVTASYLIRNDTWIKRVFLFAGDSTIALMVAVIMAIIQFGIRRKISMPEINRWITEGVSGIAMILLIITAGGVFKQVLIDSGAGNYIALLSTSWKLPPLVFGWMITALLRVTVGSSTVAGITAAGIVVPLVASGAATPELMVLAVGAGSVFGSHVNDTGFWMFKEFFGLTIKQTFLSWTMMETTISIIGLMAVLLINSFI